MRFRVPLLPIAITVERRPWEPLRARVTVRGLMLVVVLLALYMTGVALPARRQRQQRAEQAVRQQVALLVRAAEEERREERGLRGRLETDLAHADKERREAEAAPVGSETRAYHEGLARLWLEAARKVPLGKADEAAARARALERRTAELRDGLRRAAGDLGGLERLVAEAESRPATEEWERLDLAARLDVVQALIAQERSAQAVRDFLASLPPGSPPGPAGPSTSGR